MKILLLGLTMTLVLTVFMFACLTGALYVELRECVGRNKSRPGR